MSSSSPSSTLLLLPAPPLPSSRESLHAANHAPLSSAISRLTRPSPSSSPRTQPSILTVAVAGPFLPPRWDHLQSLLAHLYSLIASLGPAPDTDSTSEYESIDIRVVLIDHAPGRDYTSPLRRDAPSTNITTIPDLNDFAATARRHPWSEILHESSEAGYDLLHSFLAVVERNYHATFLHRQLVPLPGGLTLRKTTQDSTTGATNDGGQNASGQLYSTICLGGTFDHLHPGHKLLLNAATLLLSLPRASDADSSPPDKPAVFIIGISGDALLTKKKFASELEPWPERTQSVISFLSTILPGSTNPSRPSVTGPIGDNEEIRTLFCNDRLLVRCVNIPDPFGPTITEEDIDAIVVSGETKSGGAAINDKRGENGWKALDVLEIDVLNAYEEDWKENTGKDPSDFSAKISSTEIRKRRAEARTQANGQ